MKLLALSDYERDVIVDLAFDVESCEEYVKKSLSCNWIEEEHEDEDEDVGCGMFEGGRFDDTLNIIEVNYRMFCYDEGWFDARIVFVKVA